MWHTVFIAAHAAAAALAFVAGCIALRRGTLFGTYFWSLVAMVVFLALAVTAEWSLLDAATRLVVTGFVALGGFMLWRAARARSIRPASAGPSPRYVEHVGFTLVALLDAFLVVAVLNLGAAGWVVAAVGLLVAGAGHVALRAVRDRLVPQASAAVPLAARLGHG